MNRAPNFRGHSIGPLQSPCTRLHIHLPSS